MVEYLQQELGDEQISLYTGVSYRHLLKMKGGNKDLECTPPHNVPGTPFKDVMIKPMNEGAAATAQRLNELTLRSQELLSKHPINIKRVAEGKDPANSIWLWSPGYKPAMDTLISNYPIESGSVISAVDLIKGIGVYAGLQPIDVEGATGLYDTNYEGKRDAALEALRTQDFVYLHVEASDEAGHEGDSALKIRTIENLSERIVRPIMEAAQSFEGGLRIALLPDHPTPCELRTHTSDPIPFTIYDPQWPSDDVELYDEESVKQGAFGELRGDEFIKLLFS